MIVKTTPVDPEIAANTRVFNGSGNSKLYVPGLLAVTQIMVSGVLLNAEETRVMRKKNREKGKTEPVESTYPVYEFIPASEGEPAHLYRSLLSNDGIWQKGAEIAVTGEWDAVEAPPVIASAQESGSTLSVREATDDEPAEVVLTGIGIPITEIGANAVIALAVGYGVEAKNKQEAIDGLRAKLISAKAEDDGGEEE